MEGLNASDKKTYPILDFVSHFLFGSQESTRVMIRTWRNEVDQNIKKLQQESNGSSSGIKKQGL